MVSRSGTGLLLLAMLGGAGCDRQSPAAGQAGGQAGVQANAALVASADEVPAAGTAPAVPKDKVDRTHKGEAPPTVAFQRPDGSRTTLAAFRGRPLLVNLWAIWCAPCVAELPTLNALARGNADLRVLAVSQDLDAAAPAPFLKARRLDALTPYRDPALGLSVAYGVNLPTTIFYGADGRELWRVTGALDWTGAQARALLAER